MRNLNIGFIKTVPHKGIMLAIIVLLFSLGNPNTVNAAQGLEIVAYGDIHCDNFKCHIDIFNGTDTNPPFAAVVLAAFRETIEDNSMHEGLIEFPELVRAGAFDRQNTWTITSPSTDQVCFMSVRSHDVFDAYVLPIDIECQDSVP